MVLPDASKLQEIFDRLKVQYCSEIEQILFFDLSVDNPHAQVVDDEKHLRRLVDEFWSHRPYIAITRFAEENNGEPIICLYGVSFLKEECLTSKRLLKFNMLRTESIDMKKVEEELRLLAQLLSKGKAS